MVNLPPIDILVIWGIAGLSVLIAFPLYIWKLRRNKMAKKNEEEEMGGDVVTTEPQKKKGKGFKIGFKKDKEELKGPVDKAPAEPDQVIEFDDKSEVKAPQPVEEPQPINLPDELMAVAEHLAKLAQAIAPPETPEQKKIRELEEQLAAAKGAK